MNTETQQVNKGRLSDEELKIAERIKKALDLAARAGTPAEGEAMRMVHAMRRRHALVGRAVNVAMTKAMAAYLQGAVERELRKAIQGKNAEAVYQENAKSKWAHTWRRGCCMGLIERLQDRREKELAKERQAQRRAERKPTGASTSTALTIASLTEAEEDANQDFIHGEGWSAKQRARREQRAAEREREIAEWRQWCKDHPEEAAKQQEEWRKQEERNARRRTGRQSYGSRDHTDYSALYAGKDAAAAISLEQQAETGKNRGALS